ncbi:hypothetical protein EJ06DRAFT_581730 [Trichodelitschia bisporula]|uniref:Uncharacterized protein n=1 Tax=Trichodelitschia bisporula TaxID=703511 RepID=A0A6G1HX94_9PEZI|nr:hypothetical protein EJ06DRAFT_581730 [Trichodelitschia bisporula]
MPFTMPFILAASIPGPASRSTASSAPEQQKPLFGASVMRAALGLAKKKRSRKPKGAKDDVKVAKFQFDERIAQELEAAPRR